MLANEHKSTHRDYRHCSAEFLHRFGSHLHHMVCYTDQMYHKLQSIKNTLLQELLFCTEKHSTESFHVSMLQQQIHERYQLCKNGKHLDLRSRISPPKSLSQKQLTPSCTPAYAQPLPSQKSRHSSIVNSRSDKTVPFISLMSTSSW